MILGSQPAAVSLCCSRCVSRDVCANSRINYVKQVSYLPGKHLTQSRTALEMSLFKEKLLQRDPDQSMNKFPKDMEMYAYRDYTPNANNECLAIWYLAII